MFVDTGRGTSSGFRRRVALSNRETRMCQQIQYLGRFDVPRLHRRDASDWFTLIAIYGLFSIAHFGTDSFDRATFGSGRFAIICHGCTFELRDAS